MSRECALVHSIVNKLERHTFPFDKERLPLNGIYVLFQKGESGHLRERIVRVGTHTGDNQLRSRLKQHFLNQNKDRSIFRKNIGRAILHQRNDPFLKYWELDLTSRDAQVKYSALIDFDYQDKIEKQVSQYIQNNFSFSVFKVASKEERLAIESKLISTVSWCNECSPSDSWLGKSSPKQKIVKSGLWLVNELYKTPFDATSIQQLSNLIKEQ
ncbi:MAG: hypothetical protein L3J16_03870 [Anaerolineales bacterium]|nr:hypothetical protein [Anaerolineales bacterium]